MVRQWLSRVAPAVVVVLSLGGSDVDAHRRGRHCKRVDGDFTSVTVAPPACNSPVGLCTHGTLTGRLRGTYDFVALTLAPAGDPDQPMLFVYTGESLIETRHGQMFGQDTGYMLMNPAGLSAFQTTVNVVGGSGHYEDVISGSFLVATGDLALATGDAVGTYAGELCRD